MIRRVATLTAALGLVALGVCANAPTVAAAKDDPQTRPLSAQLAVRAQTFTNGCAAGAAWVFPNYNGAISYTITYLDGGREATASGPPFDGQTEAFFGAGHALSLTGMFGSGGDCTGPLEEWKSRFQLVRATVTYELKEGRIAGRVMRNGKPVKGMEVNAQHPGFAGPGDGGRWKPAPIYSATTGADGRYTITIPVSAMKVPTVKPYFAVRPDLSGTGFTTEQVGVFVSSGQTSTADFDVKVAALKALPMPDAVGEVIEIRPVDPTKPAAGAEVFRDGTWQALVDGSGIKPGEGVRTGTNTHLTVEFDTGGRLALRPDSEVVVTGERTVGAPTTVKVAKGGVWAKCGAMKEDLDIQTTGGVMGIKG